VFRWERRGQVVPRGL